MSIKKGGLQGGVWGSLLGVVMSGSGCMHEVPRATQKPCEEPLYVVDRIEGPFALVEGPGRRWTMRRDVSGLREGMVLRRGLPVERCRQLRMGEMKRLRARLER